MKGIILAGGKGTRLYPTTKGVSKQLLPIYDKPLIYYPLSVLFLAGIRDILVISTPHDIDCYQRLLGNGESLGVNFQYVIQESPRGLAEAFVLGKNFIRDESVCLVLGDNVFYGTGFAPLLEEVVSANNGATIFGYPVGNPKEFGVVEFDEMGHVLSIEEKPLHPKSRFAVPGLYFYDNDVVWIAQQLKPSDRGELEITAVNNAYLKQGRLSVVLMGRGMAWLDTGTPQGMLKASSYVEAVQSRQGLYIACLEEIAWRKSFISTEQLIHLGESMRFTEYGQYILSLAKEL